MERIVRVKIDEGRLVTVNCSQEINTCSALLEHLKSNYNVNEDYVLVDDEEVEIPPEQDIQFSSDSIPIYYLKWNAFAVTVKDGEVTQQVRASNNSTIRNIKDSFYAETGRNVSDLSYAGILLVDTDVLKDHGIGSGALLMGNMNVIVEDLKCALSTSLTILDCKTIRELKEAYSQQSRRIVTPGATISFMNEILNDDDTIFSCRIADLSTVQYENPPFDVTIKDEAEGDVEGTHLNVADYYLISQVKELYAKETRSALSTGDKLVFKSTVLDENSMIFKAGITSGSEIILSREDSSRSLIYECGDCGADVRLKRMEPISCRACGHRIVFKKRTNRPCQYLAR